MWFAFFFPFDAFGISSISEFLQIYCKGSVWQWEKKLPAMPIIVILWCGTLGHWELKAHARKRKCFSRHLCFFHSCIQISNSSYGLLVCYLKKEIRFTLGLFWVIDIKQGHRRNFFLFFFLPRKVTSGTNIVFNWLSLTQLCCVLKKLLKSVNMVTSWTSAGSYNTWINSNQKCSHNAYLKYCIVKQDFENIFINIRIFYQFQQLFWG